ncbi:uncharacterized protein [Linepithema humile]|uniref:uncharacterized protein n=1 Tax=Linepithema humile TaxID=83485 RepID=UPI00351DD5D6
MEDEIDTIDIVNYYIYCKDSYVIYIYYFYVQWCRDCNNIIDITEEHNCSISDNNYDIAASSKNDYIERLIAAVFEREPLWKSTLPYKLRGPSLIKTLWADIDNCLGTTPGTSQIKWKNLRDRFAKEHALECIYIPSGSAAVKKKSSWRFYASLRFLAPTINYRRTISNIENIEPTLSLPSAKKEREQSISLPIPGTNCSTKKKKQCFVPITITEKMNLLVFAFRENPSTYYTCNTEKCFTFFIFTEKAKIEEKSDTSSHFEEAILKELSRMGPANERHTKPDEIESFVTYLEACLRRMSVEVSNRITKKILKLFAEEDI